jgi:hypothetical protein
MKPQIYRRCVMAKKTVVVPNMDGDLVENPIAETLRIVNEFASEHGSHQFSELMIHLEMNEPNEEGVQTGWILAVIGTEKPQTTSEPET